MLWSLALPEHLLFVTVADIPMYDMTKMKTAHSSGSSLAKIGDASLNFDITTLTIPTAIIKASTINENICPGSAKTFSVILLLSLYQVLDKPYNRLELHYKHSLEGLVNKPR